MKNNNEVAAPRVFLDTNNYNQKLLIVCKYKEIYLVFVPLQEVLRLFLRFFLLFFVKNSDELLSLHSIWELFPFVIIYFIIN